MFGSGISVCLWRRLRSQLLLHFREPGALCSTARMILGGLDHRLPVRHRFASFGWTLLVNMTIYSRRAIALITLAQLPDQDWPS